MNKFTMYSICFKKVIGDANSERKTEFMSFGFPFIALSDDEAKDKALAGFHEKQKEVEEKIELANFDLWKVSSWVPEDPQPMKRGQRFIGNMADIMNERGGFDGK